MSLSPQTIRIRHQLRVWSESGRKHWDLYRHLLSPSILHDALMAVMKNKGCAGLDGQTIREIRGREWDFVRTLIQDLRSGRFKPAAVRRVHIPKKDGTKRPLGIPSLKDRVVQKALALLLEPIYERQFHDFSYGFRPNRRAVDCAATVAKECYKRRYVFDCDIEKFFDNVSQRKLIGMLRREIVDPRVLKLLSQILRAGFQEPGKPWQPSLKGTPQGGPLSPLLANIYLHYALDEKFHRVYSGKEWMKLIRYADDFVVLTCSWSERSTIERFIREWLANVGLKLKESKTKWVDMSNRARSYQSRFEFLGFKFHLRCYKDNHQRFWIARQPSEASRRALRSALRERLHVGLSLGEAQKSAQQTWMGWCEYFRYSNANRIIYRELYHVRDILTWYMARKFRRQRKAVPWRLIRQWSRTLGKTIKPISVIPDHIKQGESIKSIPLVRA